MAPNKKSARKAPRAGGRPKNCIRTNTYLGIVRDRNRRFSTVCLMFELHHEGQRKCKGCQSRAETRYRCTVCDDFELCVPCYIKGHPHTMKKVDQNVNSSPGKIKDVDPKNYMQRCVQMLKSANECRDSNCVRAPCLCVKRIVTHTKACRHRARKCTIYQHLIGMCCYHAKQCTEADCMVPYCHDIKKHLLRFQLQLAARSNRNSVIGEASTSSLSTPALASSPPFSISMNTQNVQKVD